jgi:hypothetical protein
MNLKERKFFQLFKLLIIQNSSNNYRKKATTKYKKKRNLYLLWFLVSFRFISFG